MQRNEDALAMVSDALAVLRAVQHMRSPMVGMGHQTFGLPGEVPSAVVDYVIMGDGLTVGAARRGALAGWEFTAEDHQAWETEPAFRFLDEAFTRPEPDRTVLQARALLAVRLLSQGWLSYQPDLEVLNSAVALETLLGEATDQDKKFRILAGFRTSGADGPASSTRAPAARHARCCPCPWTASGVAHRVPHSEGCWLTCERAA